MTLLADNVCMQNCISHTLLYSCNAIIITSISTHFAHLVAFMLRACVHDTREAMNSSVWVTDGLCSWGFPIACAYSERIGSNSVAGRWEAQKLRGHQIDLQVLSCPKDNNNLFWCCRTITLEVRVRQCIPKTKCLLCCLLTCDQKQVSNVRHEPNSIAISPTMRSTSKE